MKKIELKKKEYLSPEIACYQMESCLLEGSPGWDEETPGGNTEQGEFLEDDDDDPFGGGGK